MFLKIWLLDFQKHQHHLECDRNSQIHPRLTGGIRNFSKPSCYMVNFKNHWFSQIVRKTCLLFLSGFKLILRVSLSPRTNRWKWVRMGVVWSQEYIQTSIFPSLWIINKLILSSSSEHSFLYFFGGKFSHLKSLLMKDHSTGHLCFTIWIALVTFYIFFWGGDRCHSFISWKTKTKIFLHNFCPNSLKARIYIPTKEQGN